MQRDVLRRSKKDSANLNDILIYFNSDIRMKRVPKMNVIAKDQKSGGVLNELGSYLLRGLFAGLFFEGSFIMFGFQKRVVRGVTANQLEQIRKMETEASQKIALGEVPQIPLEFLRDSIRERLQKIKLDKSSRN